MSLTVAQRLDWLEARIAELRLWLDREWVELDGWRFDGAPLALGAPWPDRRGAHRLEARVIGPGEPAGTVSAGGRVLENDLLRVELAADGTLASVRDKRLDREVLDGRGNQLWAYVDKPREWDAWDLEATYAEDGAEIAADSIHVVEDGPHRAAIRVERRFRDSRIVQDVRLWAGSARIDFATRLDWHDRRWLLKARFPPARPVARGAGGSWRPLRIEGLPVSLGALKALEEGGGLLLRAYEPQGARGRVELALPDGRTADARLDPLERETGPADLELGPFEVVSWRLRRPAS